MRPSFTDELSFITPYWSGSEMMRIHLKSIREFHPHTPILVSKRSNDLEEMETYRDEFGIKFWMEECSYEDALLRLFTRCDTEYVCVLDHDTILLSPLEPLLKDLEDGRFDLVGIEDRIREPVTGAWFRYAPGFMDATFLMFNWRQFREQWGLNGVTFEVPPLTAHDEYHYGICQKLKRHKYLKPYHTAKYGLGNLIKDGATPVLWHQWFGAYRKRLDDPESVGSGLHERTQLVIQGEASFLKDYPDLDFSGLRPACGNAPLVSRNRQRLKRWRGYGLRKFMAILVSRVTNKTLGLLRRRIEHHRRSGMPMTAAITRVVRRLRL